MTPEEINKLEGTKIEKGHCVAFVHEESKHVLGIAEYRNGGIAKGNGLTILIKPNMDELLKAISKGGYNYNPEQIKWA